MTKRMVTTTILIIIIAVIFANSAQPAAASARQSGSVLTAVNGFLLEAGADFRFDEHTIRKLAHFAEYGLLGFWTLLTLRTYSEKNGKNLACLLILCITIPIVDEFIQRYSPGRSAQISDVMLDLCGALAGAALFAIIFLRGRRHGRN